MNSTKKQPDWLIDIQNNSWNPELIISGFSIVIIYQLSSYVNEFTVKLVQETNINVYIILFTVLYVSLAIISLKLFFTLHLILRGVWIGLVGLNYVFPEGVKKQNFSKFLRQDFILKEQRDPVNQILLLEKICSSIFSIAFIAVGVSASILFFIAIASIVNLLGVPLKIIGIVFGSLLLLSSIGPYLNYYLAKLLNKEEIKPVTIFYKLFNKVSSFFFIREPIAVFQTNIDKKVFAVTFVLLFAFLGFQTSSQIIKTTTFISQYHPELPLGDKIIDSDPEVGYSVYRDKAANFRIEKASISNYVNALGWLELRVAKYQSDELAIEIMQDEEMSTPPQLLTVRIDGKDIELAGWLSEELKFMNQRVYFNSIDIDTLSRGKHVLSIDKIIWSHKKRDTTRFEHWVHIPFIKSY